MRGLPPFALLMHPQELEKPTNSGNLIKLLWPDTPVWIWERTASLKEIITQDLNPNRVPVLVFPSENSVNLEEFLLQMTKPDSHLNLHVNVGSTYVSCDSSGLKPNLEPHPKIDPLPKTPLYILLDGTWKQSRKMYNHSEYLKSLPQILIRMEHLSEFKMRHQSSPQNYSTFEVAQQILKLTQGEHWGNLAKAFFDTFQYYYIQTKLFKKENLSPKEKFFEFLLGQMSVLVD